MRGAGGREEPGSVKPDWFEIEEIYQAACKIIEKKIA